MRLEHDLAMEVCSEICKKTVLLCDDQPFNLIPLEGMLDDLNI